jgi:PleD family two-component response regulator
MGACTFLKDENIFGDLEQWIKATENALCQAKAKGKNIVVQV